MNYQISNFAKVLAWHIADCEIKHADKQIPN